MRILLILLAVCCIQPSVSAGNSCYSKWTGDTLIIGNNRIERKFIWNGGNLITYSLGDKCNGKTVLSASATPDFLSLKVIKQDLAEIAGLRI